tara:strand:+ start:410 stop:649 length:240 start_codon:yes stop_codon:yes gene_type:complete
MSYSVLSIQKSKELSSCKSFDEQEGWLNSNYPTASVYKVMYATYPIETKIMYYSTTLSKEQLANELNVEESNLIPVSNV